MTKTLEYWIADYHGFVDVDCDENDDFEVLKMKAKNALRKKTGDLPFGYESFKVVD